MAIGLLLRNVNGCRQRHFEDYDVLLNLQNSRAGLPGKRDMLGRCLHIR